MNRRSSQRTRPPYLSLSRRLQHQAIIPSYRLNCNDTCGNITTWEISANYIDPDKRRRRRETVDERSRGSRSVPPAPSYPLLGLQVWRPLPPINESTGTGCYSLVGSQGIYIPEEFEDGELILRPSPPVYGIPFQPGDVLGFYVDIPSTGYYDGLDIQRAPGDNTVWYTDDQIASTVPTYYFIGSSPLGTLTTLRNDAPAISIAISK